MLRSVVVYMGRHHIGFLALFIALGGTSYAAVKLPANSVGTKQLRKSAVTPPKVSRAAVALFKGQKGAKGDTGATGATGPAGLAGAPGSPAGSAVFGNSNNSTALSYHFPAGCCTFGSAEAGNVLAVTPNATVIARDFAVLADLAPGGVETRTVTLRVSGADTALTCAVFGSATTCDAGSATVTIPPRSRLSIKLQRSAGVLDAYVAWAFRLTTP